jgi:lipopolysaccharide/colanic/teichoic acid biosynthesis glycosyltransferase
MALRMLKRLFDLLVASFLLILALPILIPVAILVWLQDFHSPLYMAPRVGLHGQSFIMVKLRSMVIGADKTGVDSTGALDSRITKLGSFIRQYKLDELPQLWNVIKGDMSLVGPRPNVEREVALYTDAENVLLNARPGITDLASIVFSDEGEILKDESDPDIAYHQLIRPGKGALGIFYVNNSSIWLDVKCCLLTAVAIISRPKALHGVSKVLQDMNAHEDLIALSTRSAPLQPRPPIGASEIVFSRTLNH